MSGLLNRSGHRRRPTRTALTAAFAVVAAGASVVAPSAAQAATTTLYASPTGSGTTNGTQAVVYTCTGQVNQQWNLNPDGTITSAFSGLCLDVSGGGTANGTPVQLWTCDGGGNQQWNLG